MHYRITLVSNKQSWFVKFSSILANKLKAAGHNVTILHSGKEVQEGDLAFYLSYGQIVSSEILAKNNHNIIVHASDLPAGKGWSPMSWQILEGKNEICVTLFEAVERVDAGPIYLKNNLKFSGTELIGELRLKLGNLIVLMCLEFINAYPDILLNKQVQSDPSTFYNRRFPKDSMLDPDKTIQEQFDLLRIVDNDKYPAYFELRGCKYKLCIEKMIADEKK